MKRKWRNPANKGRAKSTLYVAWLNMRRRPTLCPSYANTSICEEWLNSFDAFADWALANGFRKGLSIDRIDNDGDYTPENCQWITPEENRLKDLPYGEDHHRVTVPDHQVSRAVELVTSGKATQTETAKIIGVSVSTISNWVRGEFRGIKS